MRSVTLTLALLGPWLACGARDAVAVGAPAVHAPTAERTGAPDAPGRRHAASSPAARVAGLDPAPLARVLKAHVRDGRVDYRALSADTAARRDLAAFLEAAASMDASAPLSAWLNVYNALVIQLVLERYPIASVMKVPGFFKELKRTVAGKPRTLDAIEHDIIRKRFRDARVHFALNCGAASCPPLSPDVFREASLDAQLDALARAAVADPRHVELKGGKLYLSALFFWFEEDFARDAGSVVGWIERYAPEGPLEHLPEDIPRVQKDYDWQLADAR